MSLGAFSNTIGNVSIFTSISSMAIADRIRIFRPAYQYGGYFKPLLGGRNILSTSNSITKGSSLFNKLNPVYTGLTSFGTFAYGVGVFSQTTRYIYDDTYGGLEFSADFTFSTIGAFGSRILPYFGVGVRSAGPAGFLTSSYYYFAKSHYNSFIKHYDRNVERDTWHWKIGAGYPY